jgi:hypothetical protein
MGSKAERKSQKYIQPFSTKPGKPKTTLPQNVPVFQIASIDVAEKDEITMGALFDAIHAPLAIIKMEPMSRAKNVSVAVLVFIMVYSFGLSFSVGVYLSFYSLMCHM